MTIRIDELVGIIIEEHSKTIRLYAINLDSENAPEVDEVCIYEEQFKELTRWLLDDKSVWDFPHIKQYTFEDPSELAFTSYNYICGMPALKSHLLYILKQHERGELECKKQEL